MCLPYIAVDCEDGTAAVDVGVTVVVVVVASSLPVLLSEEFDKDDAVDCGARPIQVLITTKPGAAHRMPWPALAAM